VIKKLNEIFIAGKRQQDKQTNRQNMEGASMPAIDLFETYKEHEGMVLASELYPSWESVEKVFQVYTTRFSSFTYEENKQCKLVKMNGFQGCLYGTAIPLPVAVPKDKYLFVLDMNNTTNKLMGVGFIKNLLAKDQQVRIYENPSFNRYIYKTNFYVSFEGLESSEWKQFIKDEFEAHLFYGKGNLKRGGGFTRFPVKKLTYAHVRFLLNLFAIQNPNKFNDIFLKKVYD
jgi:hypothetical protein